MNKTRRAPPSGGPKLLHVVVPRRVDPFHYRPAEIRTPVGKQVSSVDLELPAGLQGIDELEKQGLRIQDFRGTGRCLFGRDVCRVLSTLSYEEDPTPAGVTDVNPTWRDRG